MISAREMNEPNKDPKPGQIREPVSGVKRLLNLGLFKRLVTLVRTNSAT